MRDVTIIVSTFGDREVWDPLASRAVASAMNQVSKAASIVRHHAETLADARNEGAHDASTEWLIFLDADDELDEYYVAEMFAEEIEGDIRRPSTLGVVNGVEDNLPVMIRRRPLYESNFVVIGSMVRREQVLKVGGFDSTLPMSEDWDLFLRMVIDGAIITDVPDAVYRVNVRPNSRNSDGVLGNRVYSQIRQKYQAQAHLLR